MTTTKKRNKKYKPRAVRIPALVLDSIPLSEKNRRNLSLDAHVALRALKDGETNLSYYSGVSFYMGVGARLAKHCNDSASLFLLFALGEVAVRELRKGHAIATVFAVLETALGVIDDIIDNDVCKRSEWGDASIGSCYGKRVNLDAGRIVYPSDPRTWKDVLGKPSSVWIHSMVSCGYLKYVEETNRLLWIDPNEDITIWVQEPLVQLLAQPKRMEAA